MQIVRVTLSGKRLIVLLMGLLSTQWLCMGVPQIAVDRAQGQGVHLTVA